MMGKLDIVLSQSCRPKTKTSFVFGSAGLLCMGILGACGVESETLEEPDDALVSEQEQEAFSNVPMGFARVSAGGAVQTSFNSTGGTVSASHSTGNYTVTFAGLGSGGHVQIAAEGPSNVRCRSMGWSGTTDLSASVQCNAPNGTLADSAFAILFFRHAMPAPNTSSTGRAYAWVTSGGSVPTSFDYNSSGTHNTVVKGGTGSYTVKIANATAINASMMVTNYGGAAGTVCSIVYWGPGTARVECRDRFGNLVDSAFTFSYSVLDALKDQQGGHTWFDGMTANSTYTGALAKWWCSPRSVSGSRNLSLASIVVSGELGSWDASPFRRVSLVSKYGSAGYCKVESLSSDEGPTSTATTAVRCYSATGAVIAVPQFTFTHVTSDPSGPC